MPQPGLRVFETAKKVWTLTSLWTQRTRPQGLGKLLVDAGADLGAYDLGKKNDGAFGASVEPLMPIDYAIGIGTFVPNNATIFHEDAYKLMTRLMKEGHHAHDIGMHAPRVHVRAGQCRSLPRSRRCGRYRSDTRSTASPAAWK